MKTPIGDENGAANSLKVLAFLLENENPDRGRKPFHLISINVLYADD